VHLEPVNRRLLQQLKPEEVEVDIVRAEVTEELEQVGIEESERAGNVEFCKLQEQSEMALACN